MRERDKPDGGLVDYKSSEEITREKAKMRPGRGSNHIGLFMHLRGFAFYYEYYKKCPEQVGALERSLWLERGEWIGTDQGQKQLPIGDGYRISQEMMHS